MPVLLRLLILTVVNMELAYYQRKLRSICRRWLCQVEKKHGHWFWQSLKIIFIVALTCHSLKRIGWNRWIFWRLLLYLIRSLFFGREIWIPNRNRILSKSYRKIFAYSLIPNNTLFLLPPQRRLLITWWLLSRMIKDLPSSLRKWWMNL